MTLAGVSAAAVFNGSTWYGSKMASYSPPKGSVSGLEKNARYVRMGGAKSGWPRRPAIVKEPVAGPKA